MWLQRQCQRVAEFFKEVNSATLSQEFALLYQYLSAKDDKQTREEVLQAEQKHKSMCSLSAHSMLMQQSGKPFRTLFPNVVKLIQLHSELFQPHQPQLSAVSVACAYSEDVA
jgi:hypothetical protein